MCGLVRSIRALAVVVVVVAASALPASAGPPPARTLAADPATGLVDGQVITATGTGWAPFEHFELGMCRAGAVDEFDCAPSVAFEFAAGPTGDWEYTIQVDARFYTQAGASDPVDCRSAPGACVLLAGFLLDADEGVTVPLDFDPDAPLNPPVEVSVEPAAGLVDGQTVNVSGAHLTNREEAFAFQCSSAAPVGDVCAYDQLVRGVPAADGTIELSMPVFEQGRTPSGELFDCTTAPGACVVALSWGFSFLPDRVATAELTFGQPDVPEPPPTRPAVPVAAQPTFTG